MARLERYSDAEVASLEKLVKENAKQITPLSVAELAVVAEGKLPGRTADALKQRIFKMQREASRPQRAARPAKKAARKIPKPKVAVRAAKKGRFLKDPPRTIAPRRNSILRAAPSIAPTPLVAPTSSTEPTSDLTLTLPNGARVVGRPAQIAEFARSL